MKISRVTSPVLPTVVIVSLFILAFSVGFGLMLLQGRNTDSRARATVTGKTYYVAPSGSDANSGESDAPLKTIAKGIFLAQPGDTVRIKSGTYRETLTISGKKGTSSAPIRIIGDSENPSSYPVIDGGDTAFSGKDRPAFTITTSAWLTFERLKVINSSDASFEVSGSHFITFRRTIIDYHAYGILLKNKSSHILLEFSELFQRYSTSETWTSLKGSKWEGGAFTSFGGAGMNIIRYNYFHSAFNAIYLSNDEGGRKGNYYDANIWIYRNRFEDIVDDPYEPESYAFNNHFFHNTLINTHRMVSFAPQGKMLGPVYVYANMQLMTKDITKEAQKGRINSAFKIELPSNYFPNGVFLFNNSVDVSASGINGYGIDILNAKIHGVTHMNNAYRNSTSVFTSGKLSLSGSMFTGDMTNTSFGYTEPNGYVSQEPGFSAASQEDFRLTSTANARGKSLAIQGYSGFSASEVIPAGADIGAYQFGASDFRTLPSPQYLVPPGGEDASFPANAQWPEDSVGGVNPPSGPKWSTRGAWHTSTGAPMAESLNLGTVVANSQTATPKPTVVKSTNKKIAINPTKKPTSIRVNTPRPTATATPTPTTIASSSTPTFTPTATRAPLPLSTLTPTPSVNVLSPTLASSPARITSPSYSPTTAPIPIASDATDIVKEASQENVRTFWTELLRIWQLVLRFFGSSRG